MAQKDLAQESVELLVRQNLHAISSSYPSIDLTREASIAANRNLDLVQENYAAGTVSIIELLDARDAALLADLDATNAVYDFLIDLMNLQRSTAEFDFFLDPVQMDESVERIKNYIISRE